MLKIKSGSKPIGSEHTILLMSANVGVFATYSVIKITGAETNLPSEGAIVWLRLNGKTPRPADNFINLPLETFVRLFEPKSEKDVFWESSKTVQS